MTTTTPWRDVVESVAASHQARIDRLKKEVAQLRQLAGELAAAAGLTPDEAATRGIEMADHSECPAAQHARDLQRRLDGVVYITQRPDITNPGMAAVAFADIRLTADGRRREER